MLASFFFGLFVQWLDPSPEIKPWLTALAGTGVLYFGIGWLMHAKKKEAKHNHLPRLVIDWGEQISVTRGKGCTMPRREDDATTLTRTHATADFFAIRLTNPNAATVRGCRVSLFYLGVERGGSPQELWAGNPTLMSFDPLPKEFQKEQDIRHKEPRTACLCSVGYGNRFVMFSSLNNGWWHDKPFNEYFTEAGVYIFRVRISADGAETEEQEVRLYWGEKDGRTFLIEPGDVIQPKGR